LNILDQKESPE